MVLPTGTWPASDAVGWWVPTKSANGSALVPRGTSVAEATGLLSWSARSTVVPSTALMRRVSSMCLGESPV